MSQLGVGATGVLSDGDWPEILITILQCTGQPPREMSIMLRLRNPGLKDAGETKCFILKQATGRQMPDQYKEELFINQAICDVYFTMQRVLCHEKNSNTAN